MNAASVTPEFAQDDSPEARLAALKAKRAELAAAERKEAEASSLEETLRAEARALRDDEARADARKKLGKGNYAVITGVGAAKFDCVIVKRAHPAPFKAFQEKEGFKLDDLESLVEPCVVYPPRDEFSHFHTHEQPGVLTRAAEAVFYLMGVRKNFELGKA